MSKITQGKRQPLKGKKKVCKRHINKLKLLKALLIVILLITAIFGITAYALKPEEIPMKEVFKPKPETQIEPLILPQEKTFLIEEQLNAEPDFYYPEIPMLKEHQKYLFEKCSERNLVYEKVLALIKHESVFNPDNVSHNVKKTTSVVNGETYTVETLLSSDYGYFQINTINHDYLAEKLGTPLDPLDPYINIEWGTYFLSNLYEYWTKQGRKGEDLEDAVLSSYNKGITGYKKTGKASKYIQRIYEAEKYIELLKKDSDLQSGSF